MITIRTDVTQKMINMMLLFVVLLLCPITFAEEVLADDGNSQVPNKTVCGSDDLYFYDADTARCLINFTKAMKRVVVIYESNNVDVLTEDGMAKLIYIEGEKLFKGILISALLFIVCASICVVSACIYCCRINYTDRTLKRNVKSVAKKLNRDFNPKKMASKKEPLPPISESCNVVVEDAGVFVA